MPRTMLLVLMVGCGSAAPSPPIAHRPPPEPPPDWEVRRCGEERPWDGDEAFATGTLDDGTPYTVAPVITDRPLEIALLRTRIEPDRASLALVLLHCEDRRWVEHAKIDLGAADRSAIGRTISATPLAFGGRMATLFSVHDAPGSSRGRWIVMLAGDRSSAREILAQRVDPELHLILTPHEAGVALAGVRRRNGRIEGRVLAALDAQGADVDPPDALWAARVVRRPGLCAREGLWCHRLCRDVELVGAWERPEEVPIAVLGPSATFVWLGRGTSHDAPGPLAVAQPGFEDDSLTSCAW